VDFVCPAARLIVEIDGGQHSDQAAYDAKRSEYLAREGYFVIRFWNNEVLGNLEGVFRAIQIALRKE
jgi:very-short-patch-repair endonuclease